MLPISAVADIATRALYREVARWNTDDPEKSVALAPGTVPATYCWLFSTDPEMRNGRLMIAADSGNPMVGLGFKEDEDLGEVVGYLAKIDPRDGTVKWAGPESPYEIRQEVLDKWTQRVILLGNSLVLEREEL